VTFSVVFSITIVSLILISRADFSSNILDMLPLKDRVISQHFKFLSLFDTMDRIIFEVSLSDSSKSYEQLSSITGKVIDRLKKSEQFAFQGEMTPEDFFQLRNVIIQNWPVLFSRKDSIWVSRRLTKDSLSTRFDRTISGLFTFSDAAYDGFLLQQDPFGVAQFSLAKLEAFKPVKEMVIRDGFITNKTNDRILFFANLNGPGMNDTYAREAKKNIEAVENYCKENGFTLTWMGAIRASVDNTDTIKHDVYVTLPIVIILIVVICLLIYSRFYYGILAFFPTVLGIIITLAVFLTFGKLSIIILGFGAALLGITVDYAIHYLFHIDDAPEDKNPVGTLTGPIFASAFTTAGAFTVLIIAGIPGLAQLGSVTASGIIIVAILSLTILPLVIKSSKKKHDYHPRLKLNKWFTAFYRAGYDRKLFFPLLILFLFGCFFLPGVTFDGDPNNMNKMKSETVDAEKSLRKNWGDIQSGTYLVVTDTGCNSVCRKVEKVLQPVIDTLNSLQVIFPASVFTHLLPSEETQRANRQRWSAVFTPEIIFSMRQVIDSVTAKYGLEPEKFYTCLKGIVSIDSEEAIGQQDYPASFREGLLGNYLRYDGSLWYANVPVFPVSDTAWSNIDRIAKNNNILAVNGAMLGLRVVDIIKTGFFRCLVYIPFVILCILFIMLRSVRYTIAAFIPALCATGLTLGIMVLCNVAVTIVSLMVFAFIFGLGIDYTLLMLYMCRKSLKENKDYNPHAAGSITVAAGTTLAGLGVLAIAQHPVLSVLGKTGIIGIVSSYVCALIIVPHLMRAVESRYK
jgi:predicted exporter